MKHEIFLSSDNIISCYLILDIFGNVTVVEPLTDYTPATVLQESIDRMRSLSDLEHLRYREERTSMVIGDNNRKIPNDNDVTGDDDDRDKSMPDKQSHNEKHHHYERQIHASSVDEENNNEKKGKGPLVTPATKYKFQDDSPRRLQIQSPLMSSLTAVKSPTATPKHFLESDNYKPGRRMRTTFSTEQKEALELSFQKTPYPDSAQREMLAAKHQIPEARVQVCKIYLVIFYFF